MFLCPTFDCFKQSSFYHFTFNYAVNMCAYCAVSTYLLYPGFLNLVRNLCRREDILYRVTFSFIGFWKDVIDILQSFYATRGI